MSTIAPRRSRRPSPTATAEISEKPKPRRPLRWRLIAGVVVSLLLLVWFLPALVAHTPLRAVLLARATAGLPCQVSAGGASLGWLSPVVLSDVRLEDNAGNQVLAVGSISTGKQLWALLADTTEVGVVRLHEPVLTVTCDADSSNLERLLAEFLVADESEKSTALELEITGGTVIVEDQVKSRQWWIEKLDTSLSLPGDDAQPLVLKIKGRVAGEQAAGAFDVQLSRGTQSDQPSAWQLRMSGSTLPLPLLQPLLRRISGFEQAELAGDLTTRLTCGWGGDEAASGPVIAGEVGIDQLSLTCSWLGEDQLQLKKLSAPVSIRRQAGQWNVERLALECDLGHLSCAGEFARANDVAQATGWEELAAALTAGQYEVSGQIDVARLAKMLPHTIRLREQTIVRAGLVDVRASNWRTDEGWTWDGRLTASNLEATVRGQPLVWERPIHVAASVRGGPSGTVVDRLHCESEFLQIDGQGNLDSLHLTATYNLQRLAAQLDRFVDLGETQLAGDGQTTAIWRRVEGGGFQAGVNCQLRNLVVELPGNNAWREDNLVLTGSAAGVAVDNRPTVIETAVLTLRAGSDLLDARLTRPVNELTKRATWPVEITMQGRLRSWLQRLRPWTGPLDGWEIDGQGQLTATVAYEPQRIVVENSILSVTDLGIQGHGLHVSERELRFSAAGQWEREQGVLQLRNASLSTGALAVQTQNARVRLLDGATDTNIALVVWGDLGRLSNWFVDPAGPRSWQLGGAAQTRLDLRHSSGALTAEVTSEVTNLIVRRDGGSPWQEPKLTISGRCRFDAAADTLQVEQLQCRGDSLAGQLSGRVSALTERRDVQLTGQVEYDLAKLQPIVKSQLGTGVQLAGRDTCRFQINGPLASLSAERLNGLAGTANGGWQSADLYGVRLGPANVNARLQDGSLSIDPLQIAVSEGTLHLNPTVDLAPGAAILRMQQGKLIDNVRITPEMCAGVLQYVAPVLAGVTAAEGRFSVALESCHVPLAAPESGDVAGQLTVHSVQVGPGPLVRELAILLQQPAPAKLSKESSVTFRMVQGRVYHRDLVLEFPDLTIRTHGSVGLDRTLAIMAEMPVPPKWVGRDSLGRALENRIVRLPIGGTLDSPRIDRRELDRVAAEFVRDTAADALNNELGKQLDKLFRQ